MNPVIAFLYAHGVEKAEYLGDGVYAGFDGYHVWLVTEREGGEIHNIALDSNVAQSVVDYLTRNYPDAKDEA